MSEITSGTAVVSSQVIGAALVAPIVAAGACASIGYALTGLPMWDDIESTAPTANLTPNCYCRVADLQNTLCQQVDSIYQRMLQMAMPIPVSVAESIAGLAALRQTPILSGVAIEKFPHEIDSLARELRQLKTLSPTQIDDLNAKTAMVLEQSLAEGQRRFAEFIVTQVKASCLEAGWRLKDEAANEQATALIANNNLGQRLAVHVGRNGEISTDVSGFSGRDCERAMTSFYQSLEKRGVRIEQKKEQPHYLFQGGALINGGSQAQQILRNAEKRRNRQPVSGSTEILRNSAKKDNGLRKKIYLLQKLSHHIG